MKLIVGLGNPGDKYQKNRHNAGWLFVDYLQNQHADLFSNWKMYKRLEAELSEAKINREEFTLAKPQTYMNDSGRAVKKITIMHGLKNIEDLIVVHDDIDLKFGKFKIQTDRGTAGHNGVSSIVEYMKTKEFARVRIGIYHEHIDKKHASGPSGLGLAEPYGSERQRPRGDTTKFVLNNFTKEEIKALYTDVFPKIAKEIIKI